MARNRKQRAPAPPIDVTIESLSHEGRGICHVNGKAVFVFAALPGEQVKIQINRSTRKFAEASVVEVLKASPQRIEPRCPWFSVCGGCSMQHVDQSTQLQLKQQSVLDMMQHAGVSIGEILSPIQADPWGYRRRARLGVKFVQKKQRLLIGFRERNKPYLADMQSCDILIPEVGKRLPELMALVSAMDACETIPQIELAADDDNVQLVFRHLQPLSDADRQRLSEFARSTGLWVALQSAGPDSVVSLYPEQQSLSFKPLPDGDLSIDFKVSDFTQVNNDINQQMVQQALDFLDLVPEDRVLDLFCGLGNFTLPIAQRAAHVVGVEGDQVMVDRARTNARLLGLDNTEYHAQDLTKIEHKPSWLKQTYDKILLDPPRSGAYELMPYLPALKAQTAVYVSCQPSSLVRDALILCNSGYRLTHFGLMDMFPHTAHVESMAIFKK